MAIAKINYAILCGKKQGVTRTPPNWEAPWVAQTPKGMVLANSKREAHAIMKNVMPLPPAMAINKKNPRAKRRKTPESIAFFKSVSTDGYRDVLTLKDGTKVSRLVDTGHISIRRRGQSVEEYPPGTVQRDAMEKTFFTDDVEMKLYSQHIGFPTSRGNPSKNWEKRIKDATKMRSKGHVGFAGESEYFFGIDGTLYRAHILDVMDVHGYRAGARFEATAVAAPYLLETLGLKTKRNPLFGASPGSEMDRLMKRGELQISFSTDKRGRPLAWRWSGVGQWRWFRIPYEEAKLAVATGQAVEVQRHPPMKFNTNPPLIDLALWGLWGTKMFSMNPRGYPSGKHPYWATRLKDGTAFGMWFDPPVNKEQAMAAFESNFGLRPESIHALKKNPQRKR